MIFKENGIFPNMNKVPEISGLWEKLMEMDKHFRIIFEPKPQPEIMVETLPPKMVN